MPLETDLNVNPYYDDFDEEKNFNRVLFKPAVPLQARELTTLQTILQNQIERFGSYTFKEGSIIKGCNFSFDASVKYVKVLDKDTSGLDVNVGLYANGDFIRNSSNVVAQVVDKASGLETQNPGLNTLFFHYLNVGTGGETEFSNGEIIDVHPAQSTIANIQFSNAEGEYSNTDTISISTDLNGSGFVANVITVASGTTLANILITNAGSGYTVDDYPVATITHANGSVANVELTVNLSKTSTLTVADDATFQPGTNSQFNAVGNAYMMTVNDGLIFQKGHFQRFEEQSIVVTKYTNIPDQVSVGIQTTESIVNSSVDTTLLDNAAGFNNENAPGADRLKLTPTLVVNNTFKAATSNNFLSLIDFQGGRGVARNQKAVLNTLGEALARRTYEESGDYVVDPFSIATQHISGNTTHAAVSIGAGIAYVKGHRFETNNTSRIALPKATTTETINPQVVSAGYGNYVLVNDLIGQFGHENNDMVVLCDGVFNSHTGIESAGATTNNTTVAYNGSTRNIVGTARVRSVEAQDNNNNNFNSEYNIYLYDVQMKRGKSFKKHAKSIVHYEGTDYSATGAETNSSVLGVADIKTAELVDSALESIVFPFGQKGISAVGSNSTFTFKNKVTDRPMDNTGQFTVTLSGTGQSFTYGDGTLTNTQEKEIIIIPKQNIDAASALDSAVSITSGSNIVSGISSTSSIKVGDIYKIGGDSTFTVQVRSIANSTAIKVDSNITETNASATLTRTFINNHPVSLDGTTDANVSISGSTMTVDTGFSSSSGGNVDVIFNTKQASSESLPKTYVTSDVAIDTSNNAAGVSGPWSLGITDVHKLVSVMKGTGASSQAQYAAHSTDVTSHFEILDGQTDSLYGLSKIKKKDTSDLSISSGDQFVVKVRSFKKGAGQGFYTFSSYPVDDSSGANTQTSILTQEVPLFVSPKSGKEIDLRDSVDFRPSVANTANVEGLFSGSNATVNPSAVELVDEVSRVPAPETNWSGSITYHLPRKDRLVIQSGSIVLIKGVPSVNPQLPPVPENSMQLASIDVPVYPSLASSEARYYRRADYSIAIKATQLRRYTMEDIRAIDDRVTNLEYYSSLNFLEKFTSDTVIPGRNDATTDRFKNGFIVDNFATMTAGNPLDSEFKAGFDIARTLLVSRFENYSLGLKFNSGNKVTRSNDLIFPEYFNRAIINQKNATRSRTVTSAFWEYKGTVNLFPDYIAGVDNKKSPEKAVQIDIDTASGTLAMIEELNKMAPQQFTSSEVIADNTSTRVTSSVPSDTQVTNSLEIVRTQRIRKSTTTLTARQATTTKKVGDFITDISFQPYIPGREIRFKATGLRPGMRHYLYFDGQPQSHQVRPAIGQNFIDSVDIGLRLSSSRAKRLIKGTGAFGDALTANKNGEIVGIYRIPANKFFVGEREFLITDVSDVGQLDDSVSSAKTQFNCYNFTVNKGDVITSTRAAIPRASTRQETITKRTREREQVITPLPPAEVTVIENHIEVPVPVPVPNPIPGPEVPNPVPNPIPVPVPNPIPVPVPGPTIPGPPEFIPVPGPPVPVPTPPEPPEPPAPPTPTPPAPTPPAPPTPPTDAGEFTGRPQESADMRNRSEREAGFRDGEDPLSQTFMIDSQQFNGYKVGYLTSIQIFFSQKDARRGVTVELRETVNAVPGPKVLPFSRTHKSASQVSTSTTAATATTFNFQSPVAVEAGKEYCVVIMPDGNSPEYKVWTAKAGQADVATNRITNQDWGTGTMFLSTNNRTWTEYPDEDLKFKIFSAVFKTQIADVTLVNEDYEFFQSNSSNISGELTPGEEVFKVATNEAGGLTYSKGNTTVTGDGSTNFTDVVGLTAGSKIVLTGNSTTFDVVEVDEVSSATSLTLRGAPNHSASGGSGSYKFTPVGEFVQVDNNTHTVQINDSTATNSTFLFANGDQIQGVTTGQTVTINEVVDTNMSYIEPRFYRNTPEGTMVNHQIKARASDGLSDVGFQLMNPNDRFYSNSPIKVMSRSNEIVNNSGNKSVTLNHRLTSEDFFTAPVIDLQSQELLIYENIINSDTTNEYITGQGSASSKYISRTIELAEGLDAEDIKVFVNAYKPANTDVKVFAKILNSEDPTTLKDTRWSELQATGGNKNKVSSAKDRGDIIEYTYEFKDTPDTAQLTGTVQTENGNNVIVGIGTDAGNEFAAGDLIKITVNDPNTDYFVSMVTDVANTTQFTVADAPDFTEAIGIQFAKVTAESKNQAFRDPRADTAFDITYYNQDDMKFTGYKYLAIKLIMTSDSTALNPYIDDYRAIAVSL